MLGAQKRSRSCNFCNHFQKLKLIDCEDSSLLTQAVNATVHFAQESRDKLLQCIVEGMDKFDKEPSQKKKKSCLQDYTKFVSYDSAAGLEFDLG